MRARSNRIRVFAMATVLLITAAVLVFFAVRQSANLFYTPTQLAESGGPVPGLSGKIGGLVEHGSIAYGSGTKITFRVVDANHGIDVEFDGIPPALFKEDAGVVATGAFDAEGRFIASNLLAKHDENYVPRELSDVEGPVS